jgi:ribosomal protein S12 methylthiotransferase accessory factor YcaO
LGGEGIKTQGGLRPLPELFSAAGCPFRFDAATIRPLIELAQNELEKLSSLILRRWQQRIGA